MASNPRPTTRTTVTYGTLSTTADPRTLAPVLIAPRYAVHSYKAGYADAKLCDYDETTTVVTDPFDWPGLAVSDSRVDTNSAELVAHMPWVQLNDEAISGTVDSAIASKVSFANSVSSTAGTVDPKLGKFSVAVGDKAIVTTTDAETGATTRKLVNVTGVGGKKSGTTATVLALGKTASTLPIVDGSEYKGTSGATYLITVQSVDSTNSTVTAAVTALLGDSGYAETIVFRNGVATNIGSLGITIAVSSTTALVGDCWRIDCTESTVASYNTIYVDSKLPTNATVDVEFVSAKYSNEYQSVGNAYYTASNGGITLGAELRVTVGGTTCKLILAELFMNYRELLLSDAYTAVACNAANADEFAGIADPQNPMGMLYAACSQVGDGYFTMVACGEDAADYSKAINYAAQFEDLYAYVTWDQSPAVRAATINMINSYADPLVAKFKRAWFASTLSRSAAVYTEDVDGSALLASIDEDGVVSVAAPGDVITGGVAPGDYMVVYTNYDASRGAWTTAKYRVLEVTDADTLQVEGAVHTAMRRVEFVRELSNTDYAKAVASEAASFNNHRVTYVWPAGEVSCLGFDNVNPVIAAAVNATYRGALPPHAPMTDLVVPGIQLTDTFKFSDVEYDIMNSGGVWIVVSNIDGEVINYHQITTKTDGTIAEEDSCVSAGDYIVRIIRNDLRSLISPSGNVHEELTALVEGQLHATMAYIKGIPYASKYGPLIEGYNIIELGPPQSNNAAFVVKMDIDTPQPMLDGGLYFNLI